MGGERAFMWLFIYIYIGYKTEGEREAGFRISEFGQID
jgi:hypothetical protein